MLEELISHEKNKGKEIDETLNKRINNILKFLNIKLELINGNIIHISKINLAYIEPHKLIIDEITYLIFK